MDDKITLIGRKRIKPNEALIKALENLLEEANTGNLQQFSYVAIFCDGTICDEYILGGLEEYEDAFLGRMFRQMLCYQNDIDYEDE